MTGIPFRLARRPRDARGYVIPFAQFIKPDGTPDFRVMDHELSGKALRRRLCGLCGEKMRKDVWFVGGPKCVEYGFFYDVPMHRECAVYALETCPHLARTKGKYSPVPDRIEGAAVMIQGAMDDKKAEWFGLLRSTGYSYDVTDAGMHLIKAELPWLSVERWRDGKVEETEKKTIVMSNVDPSDMLFHNDFGSWNVTRALNDCRAGKHKEYLADVAEAYAASAAAEFDEAKIAAMMQVAEFEPLIAVVERGAMWLIDGRHRLEVFHREGQKDFLWYVIEEADATPYQVLYNGLRRPPFKPY